MSDPRELAATVREHLEEIVGVPDDTVSGMFAVPEHERQLLAALDALVAECEDNAAGRKIANEVWDQAEARARRYEEALREISIYTASENIDDPYGRFVNDRLKEIARAALAEEEK